MLIRITNKEIYSREIQFYKVNRWLILAPKSSYEVNCESPEEFAYYNLLSNKRFIVTILDNEESEVDVISEKSIIDSQKEVEPDDNQAEDTIDDPIVEDDSSREAEDGTIIEEGSETLCENSEDDPYSDYSDEDLKTIIQNLGVKSRARSRWSLISIIQENLPEGSDIKDYLA